MVTRDYTKIYMKEKIKFPKWELENESFSYPLMTHPPHYQTYKTQELPAIKLFIKLITLYQTGSNQFDSSIHLSLMDFCQFDKVCYPV